MPDHKRFDIIVIGGGHAGIEAASVGARRGLAVLLLTLDRETIGQMSCNPSIGGQAKGHLVRELDALGGLMGMIADRTVLQFRMLNRSKGPAVWSPRTQHDREAYRREARRMVEDSPGIVVEQDQATAILVDRGFVTGIQTRHGNEYRAPVVIVTAGTFLNGLMHIGTTRIPGGRLGEAHTSALAASLRTIGFRMGRLKTGTSPRLAIRSIDISRMRVMPGEEPMQFYAPGGTPPPEGQMDCYATATTIRSQEIIRRNLDRSPLYSGQITGIGPRYCPSIETKVVRFAERPSHQVFIEPEGRDAAEVYVSGLATSLPGDVQYDLVHSIPGLERAVITRPGYAVEYDFVYPVQLHPTMETKLVRGLYCAGQINGTSGYEEAAVQGLIAGINATCALRGEESFVLRRHEAYAGVLVDDLATKEICEPYRMFTSLAEHRLMLRLDNVEDRLLHYGVRFGLVRPERLEQARSKRAMISQTIATLKSTNVRPEAINVLLQSKGRPPITEDAGGQDLYRLLKRPEITWNDLQVIGAPMIEQAVGERVAIEVKYEGYLAREEEMVRRLAELEAQLLPETCEFDSIPGLSTEARGKLGQVRPRDLAQASRIQGISPSDLLVLLLYLRRSGAGIAAKPERL